MIMLSKTSNTFPASYTHTHSNTSPTSYTHTHTHTPEESTISWVGQEKDTFLQNMPKSKMKKYKRITDANMGEGSDSDSQRRQQEVYRRR